MLGPKRALRRAVQFCLRSFSSTSSEASSRRKARLAVMMLAVLAITASALPGLGGAADSNDPPRFERPDFKGTPQSSSEPIPGTIEEYEAKRKAKRGSKDARERRKALRRAHKGLSQGEARDLAKRTFPELFGEIPVLGQPRKGERVAKYVDDFTAIIENGDGRRGLSVSTLPLRVKGADGEKKRPDLGLVRRGEVFEPEQAMTPVEIDTNPAGGFTFEGTGVAVRPVVVDSAAAGTEVDGRAFFGNVGRDADMLVTPTPYGLETFTMLRSEDSPEKQVFEFDMPEGARLVLRGIPGSAQNDPTGATQFAEVLDRDDKGIIRIAPPSATDADGERIPVTYEVEGNRLTVRAAHRDGDFSYPIQVDPLYDVYEDFWSWREYPGWVDYNGWWHSVNANQGCSWGWYQGAVEWNSWHEGLYNWSNQGNFCVDNSWGEWLWRAPRASRIFRAEFGFMRHWNAYSCIQQGVWDVQNGGWDAPWEHGGAPFENCNFAPNEPTSDFKTACGDSACNNWQGSPGNVAVFKLRHMFDGTRSVKPKAYLGGAAFHLQDSDNPVFETINHTPPSGWVDQGGGELWPRAHDDGVGMHGFEFLIPGVGSDWVDNGCGGARCPGVWETPNGEHFGYSVAELPEGVNTLTVRAYDILDKTTDHTFQVRKDTQPPAISRSGSASASGADLGDARYGVHADANDGSSSNPRSGTKSLEFQIDGRRQGSVVQCSGYSCSHDWELHGERLADGKHTLKIVAVDQLNHSSSQEWEVTIKHAASSDIGPGTVNLKTGSLSVTEQDASIDASGQGLAVGRTYNSRDIAGSADGPFGPGWVPSLPVDGPSADFVSLSDLTATADNTAEIKTSDGSGLAFTRNPSGEFVAPEGSEELKLKRRETATDKVAQWRLNETSGNQARDSRGSNHGTYSGGYTLNQPGAMPDGDAAVGLDGTSGRIVVPDASSLEPSSAISIEAWVKPTMTSSAHGIARKNMSYFFKINTGNIVWGIWSGGQLKYLMTPLPAGFTTNQWHHFVATYNGSTLAVYIDGELFTSTPATGAVDGGTAELHIGSHNAGEYFNGTLDDVSLYSRALSSTEISDLARDPGTTWELSDPEANTTVFARTPGNPDYVVKRVRQAGSNTTSTFDYDAQGRLMRATAPPPAGVNCSTLVRGCRALTLVYATSTTATGTTPGTFGHYTGRLQRVDLTAYDRGAAAMTTTPLVEYRYDSAGRLRETWDPRIAPELKTTYAYDAAGHMTTLTPPGQEPWTIAYAAISGDPDTGRVKSVSRAALPGTATTTVVYQVPLSGSGAPYAMSSSDVAAWGQTQAPTEATAIFPPDQVPASPPASYSRAMVHYMDARGRQVNLAAPGGRISTTEYDSFDNTIRELSAANRARALAAGANSATEAQALDTERTYSADGTVEVEELGPRHAIVRGSGAYGDARKHTVTTYNEGAPAGTEVKLPTTIATGAKIDGVSGDVDVRTTKLAYDGQSNLGWTLRQPTSKTVDAVTGGLNLKEVTLYDSASGNVTETRMPANPNGGDARSTQTLYYSAGAHADAYCGNTPEWAGLECKTQPAAQPGTAGLPDLPVTTTRYNRSNLPTVVTKTVGSSTTTTTVAYDGGGRKTSESTVSSSGSPLPAITTTYNPTNGLPATSNITEGVTTKTITRGYDTLARPTSYTDSDGVTSTKSYDLLSRVTSEGDGKGTKTYSYDATTGLTASMTDSNAGTFTASYDADGQMTAQNLPNGLKQLKTYDSTGQLGRVEYVKTSNCSSNCTWLDYNGAKSIHDQWVVQNGSQATRDYTYDGAGRLTRTKDTPTGQGCTVRDYAFDTNSNRLSKTTRTSSTSTCDTSSPGTVQNHAYDVADRQIDAGIVYDDFGRETSLPASHAGGTSVAMTYYADDQTHSMSQNGVTKTYSLDPMRRQRQVQTIGGDAQTKTFHYSDDSDSPSWTAETTDGLRYKRSIEGIDGDLIALYDSMDGAVLTLTNLHGDVTAHASLSTTATGPTATFRADEFGIPQGGSPPRYGYLGSKQRRTELASGIVQMGMRTYVPTAGRFTAVDPVRGGSANAYDYAAADPVNNVDLDGRLVAGCVAYTKGETTETVRAWGHRRVRGTGYAACNGRPNPFIERVRMSVCINVYSAKRDRWVGKKCRARYLTNFNTEYKLTVSHRCKARRPIRFWRITARIRMVMKDGTIHEGPVHRGAVEGHAC